MNVKCIRDLSVMAAGLLVSVVSILGAACGFGAPTKLQASAPPPAAVVIADVEQRTVPIFSEFVGQTKAYETVEVRARVEGVLNKIYYTEGAVVNKGELLVTIDPASYQAEVDRADAQVVAAQARLTFTRSEHDRMQRLLEDHAIAQREYDQSANAFHEADANLRAAQASLQSARLNLSWTQVRAPVAGRVGKLEITTGNLVAAGPGAPVLTTLVSVSPIYASFDADEQVVARALRELPPGASARAQIEKIPVQMGTVADTTTPIAGHLQLVDNQVDARSGTVRVRAVFDNADGNLMPGQFAHLRMGQVKPDSALLINERAVGTDQSKKFVMVVGADDKAQYREVTLGANVDGLRIVTSGLKPGERIVVNGLQRVRPGALVAPQVVAMRAADDAAPAAKN